ncbi:unnamed protein product [Mytilus coruscus]|uniref:RRM domain-containing protein n=1 Tax=Mytilus coruscus TaxID=42192 RepID=A0A6J8ETU4_MYTCO|nr:unnamed protein product [Mytilus coruscus]
MTTTLELPSVSKKEQQQIVERLPTEINVTEEGSEDGIIKIDGKQVNSIVLDLRVCSGIFRDIETLRSALMSLIQKVLGKGKIDTNVQGVIFVTLTFNSRLSSHEAEVLTGLLTQAMSYIPNNEREGRSHVDTIDTAMSKMLEVSNIPSDATEDALIFFFENKKRSGGGDVKNIDYNKEKHTAIVTFKDANVVQRVVDKNPLIFQIKLIEVATHMPGTMDESQLDDGNSSAPHASALDQDEFSAETIAHYLESTRVPSESTTTTIDIDRVDGDAYINFNINEVVQRVVYNNPLLFQVKLIEVAAHIPRILDELQPGTHASAADREKLSAQTNVRCFESRRVTTTNNINIGKFDGRVLVNFLKGDKYKKDMADIPVSLDESQPDDGNSSAVFLSDVDQEELYAETIAQYFESRRVTNINIINIAKIERDAYITLRSEKGLLEDLDIDKKMWLAVGISLHTIIATELRINTKRYFSKLYKSMVISNQIDTQTYPYYLKIYPNSNSQLNYEEINNNNIVHGHEIHEYDYTVRNAVDLSKLFLPTGIAQYDDFDKSCCLPSLIRIITHVDIFPEDVKDIAREVESNISSKWPRCDFTELDKVKFMSSFTLMEKFMKTLELIANEESTILNNPNRWKNIGRKCTSGGLKLNTLLLILNMLGRRPKGKFCTGGNTADKTDGNEPNKSTT